MKAARSGSKTCKGVKSKSKDAIKNSRKHKPSVDSPNFKAPLHTIHEFSPQDSETFSTTLLSWYREAKRELPWRTLSGDLSSSDRAYAVLVSEVMLQQTQVVTVLQYYEKWMKCWPTFSHLAEASLDDVNRVWSGMGYYSRAKRLWEAAKMVTFELGGKVPQTSKDLQDKLPGVGRYTAGAVASIVFGERVPAVDGNVIRVISRVRSIGADSSSKVVTDHIWTVSDQLVPKNNSGDYNQAMMDLGATICTPKKPSCDKCPVSSLCNAFQRVQNSGPLKELQLKNTSKQPEDIEDVSCHLCLSQPWDYTEGVMNFPRKSKKAPPRSEVSLVCIVYKTDDSGVRKCLLSRKPQGGLLGGLWEFPSLLLSGPRMENAKEEVTFLKNELLLNQWGVQASAISPPSMVAVVPHIFSHIHKSYVIYCVELTSNVDVINKQKLEIGWMTYDEVGVSAISTAMKKVFAAFSKLKVSSLKTHSSKRQRSNSSPDKGAKRVTDYFKRVAK